MDRRVKYSLRVLNESLVEKLKTKPIARITVKELCEAADVNRSTYYRHFLDPYDQLEKLFLQFVDDLVEYIVSAEGIDDIWGEGSFRTVERLCEYIYEHRELYLVLSGAIGRTRYDELVREKVMPHVFETLFRQGIRFNEKEAPFVFEYLSGGCNNILNYWLRESGGSFSPAEISDMLHRFNAGGLERYSS